MARTREWAIFGFITLLCLSLSVHAVTLTETEVFIKNEGTAALSNDLVTIPISFADAEGKTTSNISSVRIGGLLTQTVPTSYHASGNVRTALVRVLASTNAGQETILPITTGSNTGTFAFGTGVQSFLTQGQLKVYAKDIKGGLYEAVFDGDDTSFVQLVEDGPLVKVYKLEKNLRPVAGCNALTAHPSGNCLLYFFSTTVYVTVVSGKPHAKIDVFITNFGNLAEDTIIGSQGSSPKYGTGQNGGVFFDSIWFEVNTPGQNHSLYITDAGAMNPSLKEVVSSTHTRYWVLPTDAQNTISGTYNDGPSLSSVPQQSNFMGAGQSLLTRGVVYFGTPLSYDYYEENQFIHAGQSLERWNKTGGYLFPDLINPNAITPNFDFKADAVKIYNQYQTQAQHPSFGYRWGLYNYLGKDLGTTGWMPNYRQEPTPIVHYLLSCQSGCRSEYVAALRTYLYGTAQVVGQSIGFHPKDHPGTLLSAYREPDFENISYSSFQLGCQIPVYSSYDALGFCSWNVNADAEYKKDAEGNGWQTYNYTYRPVWHGWSARDGAHMSLGIEYYRYLLRGDYAALHLLKNQANKVSSVYHYTFLHANGPGGYIAHPTRDKGRSMLNIGRYYQVSKDPFYRTLVENIITIIDAQQDKSSPSEINPVTGEFLPVKYFSKYTPACPGGFFMNGQDFCRIQLFEEAQVLHGLVLAYRDVLTSSTAKAKVRQMIENHLYFIYEFATKRYDEVQNGIMGGPGNSVQIHEGTGGIGTYNTIVIGPGVYQGTSTNVPLSDMKSYTQYNYSVDHQVYQGICNATQLAKENNWANATEYGNEFKDIFDITWVKKPRITGNINSPGQNEWSDFGVHLPQLTDNELCGLHNFTGLPNADEAPTTFADNDGDGFTALANDCADNDPTVNAMKSEMLACSDNKDNDCDGLIDCQDPDCGDTSFINACNGKSYCGNLTLNGSEVCDTKTYNGNLGINTCAQNLCVSPFVSYVNGCQCAAGVTTVPHLNGVLPNNVPINTAAPLTLNGSNFQSGATLNVGSLSNIPTVWQGTPTQLTATLSTTQLSTLGVGSHSLSVKNPDGQTTAEPVLLLVYVPSPSDPTSLSASASGTTISLSWVDNAVNENNYHVQRSTDNFSFTTIGSPLPPNTTTYSDTGLGNGTYYYRVYASNAGGNSGYSNTSSATIGGGVTPQPDVLSAASVPGSTFTTLTTSESKTLQTKLTKLQTTTSGYANLKTVVFSTVCRKDDPDPLKSQLCTATSTYGELVEFVYTDLPITNQTFVARRAVNFGSNYPAPLITPVTESSSTIPDAGATSDYTLNPSTDGLVPGTYRLFTLVGPGLYDFTASGSPVPTVESDITNNLFILEFTVQDSGTVPPGDDEPPITPPTTDGPGGGGGGAGGGGGGASGGGDSSSGSSDGSTSLTCIPVLELCNGVDDDCDAIVDEGCESQVNTCQNGIKDEGELGVDCGGVCAALCGLPVPDSTGLFFLSALNPIFVLIQALLRLLGL